MKDTDQNLLSEAYKRVYMEDDSISVDDAIGKHKAGESLMILNADGQEFVVAGDDEEGIVDDQGKLRFNGNGPGGEEVSALEDEVSRIRSLSDHETIKTPEVNPYGQMDPGDPLYRQIKQSPLEFPESVNENEDKKEDKDKSTSAFGGAGQVKQDFDVKVAGVEGLKSAAKKGWAKLKGHLAGEKCNDNNKDAIIKRFKHIKRHER